MEVKQHDPRPLDVLEQRVEPRGIETPGIVELVKVDQGCAAGGSDAGDRRRLTRSVPSADDPGATTEGGLCHRGREVVVVRPCISDNRLKLNRVEIAGGAVKRKREHVDAQNTATLATARRAADEQVEVVPRTGHAGVAYRARREAHPLGKAVVMLKVDSAKAPE